MEFVINYWAVLAAAVVYMIVGSLWYGPLFGKQWMAYAGITPESMKSMPLNAWQAMAGGFVTALITSYILAHVAQAFVAVDALGAVMLGFWMWLGFVATTQAGSYLWEGRPFGLFVLNASMSLVSLLLMSLVIVLWSW